MPLNAALPVPIYTVLTRSFFLPHPQDHPPDFLLLVYYSLNVSSTTLRLSSFPLPPSTPSRLHLPPSFLLVLEAQSFYSVDDTQSCSPSSILIPSSVLFSNLVPPSRWPSVLLAWYSFFLLAFHPARPPFSLPFQPPILLSLLIPSSFSTLSPSCMAFLFPSWPSTHSGYSSKALNPFLRAHFFLFDPKSCSQTSFLLPFCSSVLFSQLFLPVSLV